MRTHHRTLEQSHVHRYANELLQRHVMLGRSQGKADSSVLWSVLIVAATAISSIHATCRRLLRIPCEETIRRALHATLPDFHRLQQQLNAALAGTLPRALRRRPQRLAIDLTLIPYHGRPFRDAKEIYRGLAKQGTSHFHAYATAYLVLRGQRFTVALTAVAKGESMKAVLQRLLKQARSVGVQPRLLLLDRGFYSLDVVRYLKRSRCPFLMPAMRRGRKADHPNGASGTRVFAGLKQSGWHQYQLGDHTETRHERIMICVVCRNYRGQWGRHQRQTLVYACWGVPMHSCVWVRETYRLRFGIESSYRQMNQGRGRTCTRRPGLRLLYVGIALILRTVWVWLHYEILSTPRRGGRILRLARLRLGDMLHWLGQVIEQRYGTVEVAITERQPYLVLTT